MRNRESRRVRSRWTEARGQGCDRRREPREVIVGVAGKMRDTDDGEWPRTASQKEFKEFCRWFGEQVGSHGHRLVVRSHKKETADRNVVEGYLRVYNRADGAAREHLRIFVTGGSRSHPHSYAAIGEGYPGLFASLPLRTPRPRSDHLIACTQCHATVCIGGGSRTELIGHAVLAARRQLVPIVGSGGAAKALYEFATRQSDGAFLPHQIGRETLLQDLPAPQLQEQLGRWLADAAAGPTVVLIHGHDLHAVESLKQVLQRDCALPERNVRLMREEVSGATSLIDKWERVAREATAAIVLATPDDEGALRPSRGQRLITQPRARQNVWLEFGWMWSSLQHLGRLLVLTKARANLELEVPSDVKGIEVISFEKTPEEQAEKIKRFIDDVRSMDERFAALE
jgi:predicted nucleotide-binding protein